MTRERLADEAKRLRACNRAHRGSTGHDLCWHHPKPWAPLPGRTGPEIAVPPRPGFLRDCVRYREGPDAPVHDAEYQ